MPARFGNGVGRLMPLAPWQAAHTWLTRARPAPTSAERTAGVT